jgi:hypothetical protein
MMCMHIGGSSDSDTNHSSDATLRQSNRKDFCPKYRPEGVTAYQEGFEGRIRLTPTSATKKIGDTEQKGK